MTTRINRTSRRRAERRPGRTRTALPAADQRTRRSGGPEDLALYACSCGKVFTSGVTTSVACPRCGSGQAW